MLLPSSVVVEPCNRFQKARHVWTHRHWQSTHLWTSSPWAAASQTVPVAVLQLQTTAVWLQQWQQASTVECHPSHPAHPLQPVPTLFCHCHHPAAITACVQDTNSEVLRPIKVLTFTELTALLQPMYDKWTNLTGYKANIVSMPLSPGADDALTKEILFSLRSNFTTYDGYAFDTLRMTEIGQLGGFADIRSLIAPDNR
ncbi:hypothetical protein HaLaN_08300 [Haematococcus lacustris]|uniref:Uncharacterized protein n=1 Tax=Haematococcus lacustris TaxID=44745 RepID=A0A699YQG4_HAELA|nr:hypothetical protein HaLaN_08300 [Haematococcus lacustris]